MDVEDFRKTMQLLKERLVRPGLGSLVLGERPIYLIHKYLQAHCERHRGCGQFFVGGRLLPQSQAGHKESPPGAPGG